ncbi:MAG: glutamine amidotransferase, partial [Pseudomonadota bacterium]
MGLFIKDKALEANLGELLSEMLVTMSDRGPDSAGIAVYGTGAEGHIKISVQSETPDTDFAALSAALEKSLGADVEVVRKSTHAIYTIPEQQIEKFRDLLATDFAHLTTMSRGQTMEI